jgi:hypothetical protein
VSFPNLPVSSADHVAVTCHYIDDECNLVEALLDFSKVDGEHSGFNLAAKLMGILEEYDIVEKVNCITSDSASNNNRMVKELEILFNDRGIDWPHEERHIPCVTHVINIAVQEFLKYIKLGELNAETFTLSELLENIRQIALHIKKSDQTWAQFESICVDVDVRCLKILLDVPTRWNSTHRMLERILYLRKAIDRYVLDHQPALEPVTEKHWELLELLCAYLWPFKNCTEALESTKKPEIDRVFWVYNRMINEIEDLRATLARREARRQPWAKELLVALAMMQEKVKKYYEKTTAPMVYVDAMILNPKLKLSGFIGPEWEAYDAEEYRIQARARYMSHYANRTVNTSTTSAKRKASQLETDADDDDGDEYDRYVSGTFESTDTGANEFDSWIASPRERAKCSLVWWAQNSCKFPRLALMMRDACAVPPSGSGVERQFSIAGRVATWQRNQLSPKSICEIMMYKNHMDRKGIELELSQDAINIHYDIIPESEVESAADAEVAVKSLAEWRSGWNAGMKR